MCFFPLTKHNWVWLAMPNLTLLWLVGLLLDFQDKKPKSHWFQNAPCKSGVSDMLKRIRVMVGTHCWTSLSMLRCCILVKTNRRCLRPKPIWPQPTLVEHWGFCPWYLTVTTLQENKGPVQSPLLFGSLHTVNIIYNRFGPIRLTPSLPKPTKERKKKTKITDLQAHNASPCDALWACRSAIFK